MHAFDKWFARKADETAYVCHQGNDLVAFLYLKVEGPDENYSDIEPRFPPKRRLKIGTFKVEMNGFKLGERFLKIIFDNALRQNVEEIYVTIFQNTAGQQRLVRLLQDFGFVEHGTKTGPIWHGACRWYASMREVIRCQTRQPSRSPSSASAPERYIVPIWPDYHTEPVARFDSANGVPGEFRRAVPAPQRDPEGVYQPLGSTATCDGVTPSCSIEPAGTTKRRRRTVGIVENVHLRIRDAAHFISLCRKRSVFDDKELIEVVGLQAPQPSVHCRVPVRVFIHQTTQHEGVNRPWRSSAMSTSAPRGFEPLTKDQFRTILQLAQADARGFVD